MNWLKRFFRPQIYLNTQACKIRLIESLANELSQVSRYGDRDSGVVWLRKKATTEQLKERL